MAPMSRACVVMAMMWFRMRVISPYRTIKTTESLPIILVTANYSSDYLLIISRDSKRFFMVDAEYKLNKRN